MYEPASLNALREVLESHSVSLLGFERKDGKPSLIVRRTGSTHDATVVEFLDTDDQDEVKLKVLTALGVGAQRTGENPEVGRVTGYRKLTDRELRMVNDVKELGDEIEVMLQEAVVNAGFDKDDARRNERVTAINHARTNLQQGAMWLIRGIAAPQGLF